MQKLYALTAVGIVAAVLLSHEPAPATEPEAAGVRWFFNQHFPEWGGGAACDRGEVDDQQFIRCRPSRSDALGALFLLEPGKAIAMNGQAIQWSERGRMTYEDGRPLEVERWTGGPVDVPAVVAQLR